MHTLERSKFVYITVNEEIALWLRTVGRRGS